MTTDSGSTSALFLSRVVPKPIRMLLVLNLRGQRERLLGLMPRRPQLMEGTRMLYHFLKRTLLAFLILVAAILIQRAGVQ